MLKKMRVVTYFSGNADILSAPYLQEMGMFAPDGMRAMRCMGSGFTRTPSGAHMGWIYDPGAALLRR